MKGSETKVRIDNPRVLAHTVDEFFEDVDAHILACRGRPPQRGRLPEEACRTRPEPELPYDPDRDDQVQPRP